MAFTQARSGFQRKDSRTTELRAPKSIDPRTRDPAAKSDSAAFNAGSIRCLVSVGSAHDSINKIRVLVSSMCSEITPSNRPATSSALQQLHFRLARFTSRTRGLSPSPAVSGVCYPQSRLGCRSEKQRCNSLSPIPGRPSALGETETAAYTLSGSSP